MTFITAVTTQEVTFLASDRMVSLRGQPYDAVSNKVVMARLSNGFFAFSYTGVAYIGRVATDRWIAEALRGEPIEQGFNTGASHRAISLWESTQRVKAAMKETFSRAPYKAHYHDVMIVGLRSNKGNRSARPSYVNWHITHDPKYPGEIRESWTFRRFPNGLSVLQSSIGSVNFEINRAISASLHDQIPSNPDNLEQLLVEAIRRTAALLPGTVGSDALAIRFNIGKSGIAHAKFTFKPDPAASSQHSPVFAWTPWILTQGDTFPPQQVSAPGVRWRTPHIEFDATVDAIGQPTPGLIFSSGTAFRRGAPTSTGVEPPPVSSACDHPKAH